MYENSHVTPDNVARTTITQVYAAQKTQLFKRNAYFTLVNIKTTLDQCPMLAGKALV